MEGISSPWVALLATPGAAVVLGALGLMLGMAVAWVIFHSRESAGAAERAELRARLEERTAQAVALQAELARAAADVRELSAARERLAAELDAERRGAADKLAQLGEAQTALREAFQTLSAEALRQNNQSFLDLARASLGEFQRGAADDLERRRQAIGEIVAPVRESLAKVDAQLAAVEKERVGAYAALREQVDTLRAGQALLQTETARLVQALRTPSVRGRWGEIQLRRVVELAGMLDHCDFLEQQSVSTEDGRLRPDLLIRLPSERNVVVDAKVPLGAFLEAFEAVDDAQREAKLRDHARQVRDHMTKLGSRSYAEQFAPAPEFVVMFLPGESLFSSALQYDPELIEFGVDKRVIPASPTTLIALLRAVAYGWRHERLAESAHAISRLGRDLHDRIAVMADHLNQLGRSLERAVTAFNETAGSVERRVLVTARRLKDLGVGATGEIAAIDPVERAARVIDAPQLPLPGVSDEPDGNA